ncbi:ectonucleotide pyrophosphatase/phosphodiesterase [Sporosarcina sp. Te-1]|uniref:alkaline phosphatase family protein n=1 Tax=Sporosarcina sp. Te-1 TaxID=2818390 RepID=UPI001A9F158B|nr:ectonucleotide pyrophosphatase/phosphodiesterase [Sporosarcina sp. Te-1]QTD41919.1 alkaline phosphatase family protein [Sporosarcina sp. Te-1]
MERLTDHLIVISFDCLSANDFEEIKKLPNFKRLLEGASYCRQVETIYPSVTYPCHTSIITGNYPNRHGITANTLVQPGRPSPDWYWHRRHVKGTTVYDEARRAGMSTAALLWPVTAKAKIDFHIPEIFANRKWHSQTAVSLINGSFFYTIKMNRKFGHLRQGIRQPWLDDFVTAAAAHTIRTKKPDLMLLHLVDLDSQRHQYGFSSNEASDALKRHDERLGELLQAIEDSGIGDRTTVIALGDHSSLDEHTVIKMNVLLKDSGFIEVGKKGNVTSWKAYCQSNDGSCYIFVKDNPVKDRVEALLHSLVTNPKNGIERVYHSGEIKKMGADGKAAFMLEAREGYYFSEALSGEAFETIQDNDVVNGLYTRACHGYSPRKPGYQTVFIAKGKGIQKDVVLTDMSLVDEGPTFARLLGLDLGDVDGRVLTELLTD